MDSSCSQGSDGQKNPAPASSGPAACPTCNQAVRKNATTITCIVCDKAVHVSCLADLYKRSGAAQNKNGLDWLKGFILHAGLRYTCQACGTLPDDKGISHTRDFPAFDGKMLEVKMRIDSMQKNLSDLVASLNLPDSPSVSNELNEAGTVMPDSASNSSVTSRAKPASYSAAVSNSFSEIVKSAITTSIREQKALERNRASVAIHNLREYGNDARDVHDLFDYLECDIRLVATTRIGRVGSKPRLLKVELNTISDRDLLLRAAKFLREDPTTKSIFITPWLLPDELAKLKRIKNRCYELNQKSSAAKDGKRKYVVVSGKIMERISNGSLRPFKDVSAPSAPSTVSSELTDVSSQQSSSTKNVQGGSHVAP